MSTRTAGKIAVGVVCFAILSYGFSLLRPGQWEDAVETFALLAFWCGVAWGAYRWGMGFLDSAGRRTETRDK